MVAAEMGAEQMSAEDGKKRCFGNRPGQNLLAAYHDSEWCVPVHDDRLLFEMLTLEGAQAELTWDTVLRKRQGYRQAFLNFDVAGVAAMSDAALEALRDELGIICNRLKIYSTRTNARGVMAIQREFGSFSDYIWRYFDGRPVINDFATSEDVPASTPLSDQISGDLKKRGFRFVGTTITYAFMQGVGLVDDHVRWCWCRGKS